METAAVQTVITPKELLEHWQGHRSLTRRMIEAFPENELFNHSVGKMRPFSALVMEMTGLANIGMEGVITNQWKGIDELPYHNGEGLPETKQDLLALWDETTELINSLWATLTPERFHETTLAFGAYEGPVWGTIFYWIDNEIHHRGQAYVYLRSLGITPPPFWER